MYVITTTNSVGDGGICILNHPDLMPSRSVPWNQTTRCSPLGGVDGWARDYCYPQAINHWTALTHARTHTIATSLPTMSCQSRDSPGCGVVLPDYPSDVSVRPNFSRGAYVMWNPVRWATSPCPPNPFMFTLVHLHKHLCMCGCVCVLRHVELYGLWWSC